MKDCEEGLRRYLSQSQILLREHEGVRYDGVCSMCECREAGLLDPRSSMVRQPNFIREPQVPAKTPYLKT